MRDAPRSTSPHSIPQPDSAAAKCRVVCCAQGVGACSRSDARSDKCRLRLTIPSRLRWTGSGSRLPSPVHGFVPWGVRGVRPLKPSLTTGQETKMPRKKKNSQDKMRKVIRWALRETCRTVGVPRPYPVDLSDLACVVSSKLNIPVDDDDIPGFAVKVIRCIQERGNPDFFSKAVRKIAGPLLPDVPKAPKNRAPKATRDSGSPDRYEEFYQSWGWKRLRYAVVKERGRRCECCGATPENGIRIVCDHIKPIRKYWSLRLDRGNIQILCDDCNMGKGSHDETDWRPVVAAEQRAAE